MLFYKVIAIKITLNSFVFFHENTADNFGVFVYFYLGTFPSLVKGSLTTIYFIICSQLFLHDLVEVIGFTGV